MGLAVTTTTHDAVQVVHAEGDLDVATAATLRDALDELIADGRQRIALDLTDVGFLDSTGLGVIVGRLKLLRRAGGTLTLAADGERILRVFEITGLDKVFAIHDTVGAAVAAASVTQE